MDAPANDWSEAQRWWRKAKSGLVLATLAISGLDTSSSINNHGMGIGPLFNVKRLMEFPFPKGVLQFPKGVIHS